VLHCSIEAVAANVQSGSFDEPGLHVKAAGFADPVEQIGFRRGHPNLPLIHEVGEERRTSPLVEMRRNFALEDDELAAGFVLTCQARPTTDTVTVDYDS